MGRADVLDRLGALSARGARLVTLWGPAGIGKTRLALRHLELARLDDAEGVAAFCDVTEAHSVEDVSGRLMWMLGLPSEGASSLDVDRLRPALSRLGRTLLVIDNFEHVSEAATLLTALLDAAPNVRLLVTSRTILGVPGEEVVELEPLSWDLEAGGEGVTLFLERSRALQGGVAATPEDRITAAEIVRCVDGLPLAIEMAAGRTITLTLREILARLGSNPMRLAGPPSLQPRRHTTLERALQWSWDLLAPAERRALAEASIFRGGFGLGDAEAILTKPEGTTLADLLHGLRIRSLLRVDHDEVRGARFSMLLTVRDFSAARLDGMRDADALRRRHARHYVSERHRDVDDLAYDLDNVVAAHRWASLHGGDAERHELALRLALSTVDLLTRRGKMSLLLDLLRQALVGESAAPRALIAEATLALGNGLTRCGQLEEARALLERGRSCARDAGATGLERRALAYLAYAAYRAGRRCEAEAFHEETLRLRGNDDDASEHTGALAGLGWIWLERGEASRARGYMVSAARLLPPSADPLLRIRVESGLGEVAVLEERFEDARHHFQQALAHARAMGSRRLEAFCLGFLGLVSQEQGDFEGALEAIEAAQRTMRDSGDDLQDRTCILNLGLLALERGDDVAAHRLLVEASAPAPQLPRGRQALPLAALAVARARLSELGAAEVDLDRARAEEVAQQTEAEGRPLAAFVELCGALVSLAHADRDRRSGRLARALALEERARVLADRVARGRICVDSRLPLRLLRAALEARQAPAAIAPIRPVLVVGPQARWLWRPPADRAPLPLGPAARRILLTLVEQHRRDAGRAVPSAALFGVGWPKDATGANQAGRVRLVIHKLRSAGLADVLIRSDGGYLLSPDLSVATTDDAPAHGG